MSKVNIGLAALLFVACTCNLAQRASAGPIQTSTTTLSISPAGSVVTGTALTMTATVTETATGSTFPVTQGTVVFCDANAVHCEDSAIFGIAQLTAAGTATIRITLGAGTYSISAAFQGKSAPPSVSGPQSLTVEGNATYSSFTNITATGTAGNYTLIGAVTAFGREVSTGVVSFLDTDSGDAVVGTAVLDPTTLGFTFLPAIGSPATVGSRPQNALLGDFNNDGHLDLATTNSSDNTISISLGNGDGTFQLQATYAAGTSPSAIASGDFNQDGNLDLVVSNPNAAMIGVFLGNGNGTFLPVQTYTVGSGAQSIAVGDFDGDGIPDLAVLNRNDANVMILLGQGDGTFLVERQACVISSCPALTFPVGEDGQVVATSDLNGDGNADLVVTNAENAMVSVLLGLGNGTFQTLAAYAVRFNPIGLAISDFNQDGIPDLAVANAESNQVSVLLGVGDGTFLPQATYAAGRSPEGVSVGDFNGDGNMDLVVSNNGASSVSLLLGNGDGTFRAQVAFPAGARPFGMAVGDLNGDGLPDVAVANSGVNTASILLSAQTETATATGQAVFGTGSHEVLASYAGDTDRAASESDTVLLDTIPQTATATTLTAGPNPAFAGQLVTLTATIVPTPVGIPGGTVSFFNGTTLLGTGTVNSSGIATFTTGGLPTGSLSLTAAYSGNTATAGSTSTAQNVTINPQTATTTVLQAAPNPATAGQAVTLTATVAPAPAGVPAGTVSFFQGSTLLGTANLNPSGVAVFTIASLASGTNTILAVYSGNRGLRDINFVRAGSSGNCDSDFHDADRRSQSGDGGGNRQSYRDSCSRAHGDSRRDGQLFQRQHPARNREPQLVRRGDLYHHQPRIRRRYCYGGLFRQRRLCHLNFIRTPGNRNRGSGVCRDRASDSVHSKRRWFGGHQYQRATRRRLLRQCGNHVSFGSSGRRHRRIHSLRRDSGRFRRYHGNENPNCGPNRKHPRATQTAIPVRTHQSGSWPVRDDEPAETHGQGHDDSSGDRGFVRRDANAHRLQRRIRGILSAELCDYGHRNQRRSTCFHNGHADREVRLKRSSASK